MMRLILLIGLVLLAFASNSLLNRAAVGTGEIDAMSFALVRAVAGALCLVALVWARGRTVPMLARARVMGAGSLSVYLVGFSLAYIQIDAGLGALILFGAVQVTMFAGSLIEGDRPPARRWIGAGVALAGLAWLIWPAGAVQVPLVASGWMLLAGVAWGLYSLVGRGAQDPLAETGANFVLSVPLCALVWVLVAAPIGEASAWGLILAVVAGAITSGLGYALWYSVLPRLASSVAGLLQLSVPVIAALGGVLLLGESLSLRLIGAGLLVLGGIAYGLGRQRTSGSKGS